MKPSERMKARAEQLSDEWPVAYGAIETLDKKTTVTVCAMGEHIDEEHERRAKFEAGVLERLGKLEAEKKATRYDAFGDLILKSNEEISEMCAARSFEAMRQRAMAEGNGVPGYEPDVAEPEPEAPA